MYRDNKPPIIGGPDNPATPVTFSQAGSYLLRLIASNSNGEVSRDLSVEVRSALDPASFEDWQELTWQGVVSPQIIGPDADPDGDGLSNFAEWALHLDATAPSVYQPGFVKNGGVLAYTYTRRKTAPGEATFTVEWSDTLAPPWTPAISDPPVSLDDVRESVHTPIPAGSNGRRFARLKVTPRP